MSNVFAQTSELPAIDPKVKVQVPIAFVIQANKNQDELNFLREKASALEAQNTALKTRDENWQKLENEHLVKIASLEKSVKNAEDALAKAEKNVGLTEQQKQLFADRLNEYKQELAETREELRDANKSKKWWLLGGTALGYGISKVKTN